ncbi:RHS repeat-associated core domain-containing protein [Escherichia coli]|nr:RHS repeat-associated core domain-containing protein [Escherichia coli]
MRLPGQQYDEESGLYYNRHRYYDPLRGRYIDPTHVIWTQA